jgi:hypothetical protein
MTPVNHTYPLLGHLNVFSYASPFIFWIAFTLQMISRMRNGHSDCSRRYEKNWRREGRSLQLVGIERCNAIPPAVLISDCVWMKPRDRNALNFYDFRPRLKLHETDIQGEVQSVELNQGI